MALQDEVTLAPIDASHVDSFHRALDVVAREKKYLTLQEAPPLEETRGFVLGMIEKGNPQIVALAGSDVVGWCDISRHFFPSHAHRGSLGMGIIPVYRGRGLGSRLLERTLAEARKAGFVRVELDVHADNARAIALYERFGFVREGVARDAACIDGNYIDTIGMAIIYR
jgi:RimJ/RimL family protein N-acetyltransferase